jgi:aminopeptidase N
MKFRRFGATSVLALLTACGEPPLPVEPGVSLALAEHRRAVLSDIAYTLSFDVPADPAAEIAGSVTIDFALADASSPLQLDFRERSDRIHGIMVNGSEAAWQFADEHIVIPGEALVAGQNAVAIDFTAGSASLNRNPGYLYTLFVPDRARTAFPLFDQPDLKATYALTLRLPRGWTAMSNAPVRRVHSDATSTEFRFEPSDLISSYLFSFVAGEFETVSRDVGGRQMTMLHRETDGEKVARNLDDIFLLHAAALDWLEEYTGIDYPFRKFGFALIPAFQYGGMEHVGAIQYRASSLLLDEAPSETRLLSRASLIAHETAHMWFGDLVTMEWFDDVWTKEVFANFMAAKIVNPSFPDVNHDLNFLVRHYPRAYSVDRTPGANSIRQFLPNLEEAGQMYGAIIYNKAPIMMRELERLIGEDAFRSGMQEYLQAHAFGNASWPGLVDILDRRADEDLRAWSNDWVNRPGRDAIQQRWEDSDADGDAPAFRYGLVPTVIDDLDAADVVTRAAALINHYEGMLAGTGPRPENYFDRLLTLVETEENQLVLDEALDQLRRIFWQFIDDDTRLDRAPLVERVLWETMHDRDDPGLRKVYYEAFVRLALTPDALAEAQAVWSGEQVVDDLPLAENDLIDMLPALAIKLPASAGDLLSLQKARTKNPDNARKLDFIAPSLSADAAVRDEFFASLADESNRETENWVLIALANLHHPLRIADAERYIEPSLALLEEIQVTGDIFFPKRWLDETLRYHRTAAAAATVRSFLAERPEYNEQLRMKIEQSAHMLFRANALLAESGADHTR